MAMLWPSAVADLRSRGGLRPGTPLLSSTATECAAIVEGQLDGTPLHHENGAFLNRRRKVHKFFRWSRIRNAPPASAHQPRPASVTRCVLVVFRSPKRNRRSARTRKEQQHCVAA